MELTRRTDVAGLSFRRFHSRRRSVVAVRLERPEAVENPFAVDGIFRGTPGAWKITYGTHPDGRLDQGICQDDVFQEVYEHREGDRYQKKPTVTIEAAQLATPLEIISLEGACRGEPGDWLVFGVKDEPYLVSDQHFRENYVAAD